MTEFDPFAAYDWPADPAAYRVETTRDANVIATIAVLVQADGRPLLTLDWTQRDTEGAAQAILADALAYGRYAPDAMPSDEHIILAAMEHCGLTPDEDGDDTAPGGSIVERLDRQHGLLSDLVGLTVDSETTAVIGDASDAITEMLHALREAKQLLEDGGIAGGTLDLINTTLAKWEG